MRDFDNCFLFVVVVVVVIVIIIVLIFSFFSFQLMRQTLSSNTIKTKMKKTKTRLTWYIIVVNFLYVWCYQCVQRFKNDWSMICVFLSNLCCQKCDWCLTNKYACTFNSTFLKLQMRLHYYIIISMIMSLSFYEEIF